MGSFKDILPGTAVLREVLRDRLKTGVKGAEPPEKQAEAVMDKADVAKEYDSFKASGMSLVDFARKMGREKGALGTAFKAYELGYESGLKEGRVLGIANEGDDFWTAVIRKVEAMNHLLSCKLSEASAELNGDTLIVKFSGFMAIHAEYVRKERQVLEGIASALLNKKVTVEVVAEKGEK